MRKHPADEAQELEDQLSNGNRKHVRDTLRAFPTDYAVAVAFYLRDRLQDDSYTIGVVGRLLTDDLSEDVSCPACGHSMDDQGDHYRCPDCYEKEAKPE